MNTIIISVRLLTTGMNIMEKGEPVGFTITRYGVCSSFLVEKNKSSLCLHDYPTL